MISTDHQSQCDMSAKIVKKAKTLGASLAGIVRVSTILEAPSHQLITATEWVGKGHSVLVLALEHKPQAPELDWWGVKWGTLGNQKLREISLALKACLRDEFAMDAWLIPYQPGVFLKDAAVLAGLGTLGDNNLLVTPTYGPRVRLRSMLLEPALAETGPIAYAPCETCDHPCWQVCPQQAFASGHYDVQRCEIQMAEDRGNSVMVKLGLSREQQSASIVKSCRLCELACPVATGRA